MKIPGFVDLQVNGYKGVDFSSPDLTEEKLIYACHELFKAGTAAFLTTMITSSKEIYQKNLSLITKVIESREFSGRVLGVHLEGPFISTEPGAVGAHNPNWVSGASIGYLKQLQQWAGGNIRLITIAAEVAGSDKLAAYASENGITVSLGHQMAKEEDINRLAKSGATAVTHLGNALPSMIDRHQNPVWASLAEEHLTAMVITDGHHIPASLIKTVLKAKSVLKVIVVSDISPAAGLPAGEYEVWGNDAVLREDGFLYVKKTGHLAGSSSTMLECMNYLASLDLLSEDELLEAGFYNPLRLINIDPGVIKSEHTIVCDKEKGKRRYRIK